MISDAELGELSQRAGEALLLNGLKLATAESCTGGWVSKVITDTAGCSAWFVGGFTTYTNKSKHLTLGVADITLKRYGAVSEETAFEMAAGLLQRSEADIALAVTGIAGPDGGTREKPLGTVCFAWCQRNKIVATTTRHFDGDREQVRRQSVALALDGLLGYLARHVETPPLNSESAPSSINKTLSSASPVRQSSPFDIIDRAKTELVDLLDHLRIDRTELPDDQINAETLSSAYRTAIARLDGNFRESFCQRILAVSERIQEACETDMDAMIGYAHLDDDGRYTVLHALHQGVFIESLAYRLDLSPKERRSMIAAALTSNIAMLNLQEILQAQAAPLTQSQQKLVRLHPLLSNDMLLELGVNNATWSDAVLSHHERVDGKGYPAGLMEDKIPLSAKIVALTDVYDAMITPRKGRDPNQREALRTLYQQRGQTIDTNLANTIVKRVGAYPPGSFVKLQNGEIGIVIKRVEGSVNPIVRSIVGPRGAPLDRPYRRNTSEALFAIQDIVPRDRSIALNLRRIWDYGR